MDHTISITTRQRVIQWWNRLPNRLDHKGDAYYISKYFPSRSELLQNVKLTGREVEIIWKGETEGGKNLMNKSKI